MKISWKACCRIAITVFALLAMIMGVILATQKPKYIPHAPPEIKKSYAIALAMLSYANDHQGTYPVGRSSTEIFQKLIDERYVTDLSIFYLDSFKIPGKTMATSNTLKPENVCWDVTVPLDIDINGQLPVVFSTGYKIDYVPGGGAIPLFPASEDKPLGIVVTYQNMSTQYFVNKTQSYGVMPDFIDPQFEAKGKVYRQLTPDGSLSN